MNKPQISLIAAIGSNGHGRHIIGKDNGLLWRIHDDLKRFKELTMGHPIIFGRKTFESIGRVLPGRTNIVVTRDREWHFDGVNTAYSLEEALELAQGLDKEKIFIGGGAQIYEQALPFADVLYLTLIEDTKEGDTFFPEFESIFSKKVSEEKRIDESSGISYSWLTLTRP